mmetsp:Transcript_33718/g.24750  ORF Transcript_33718/g.24750 Transcript_33718/m.24750 type:complete len:132 (-) Transcript_33718:101-496(-)
MSVIWIWMTANMLIDLLNLFGIITKIPSSALGLTILAWGNSTGDLMTNLAIARKGFGEMAMTGCYAGPLFNALFGFGLTAARRTIINGEDINFSYKAEEGVITLILIVGTILLLVSGLIITKVQGFKFTLF